MRQGLNLQNVGTRARKAVPEVKKEGKDAKLKEKDRSAGCSLLRCIRYLSLLTISTAITTVIFIALNTADRIDGNHQVNNEERVSQTTSSSSTAQEQTALLRRFPEFGTAAFAKQCPWAIKPLPQQQNCTILVRPFADGGSGVADWTTKAVKGFLEAQLTGCRLLVDYSESVNLQQVLVAPSFSRLLNWTVPQGFECDGVKNCARVVEWMRIEPKPFRVPAVPFYVNAPAVPFYRFALRNNTFPDGTSRNGVAFNLRRAMFEHLEQILPGFQLEQGFACSWQSMFQLAPTTAQFQPNLFTKLLPTLRDPKALVLSVNVRTGFTDHVEQNDTAAFINTGQYESQAKASVRCALQLEHDFMKGREGGFSFSRIVWMLITDSAHVKRYIVERHDAKEVHADGKSMWRTVLTTGSRGRHSKPSRNPSTADFADTMIDWYLHGECDVVVTNSPYASFSTTAAMRTNRPVYSYQPHGGRGCSFLRWSWLDN